MLIRGGRIVDPSQEIDRVDDLWIADGKIASIGRRVSDNHHGGPVAVVDAAGCVVAPGFVDLHCHLRDPGFEEKETIATGTRAAARGGFTTICCMANTNPPVDSRALVEYVQRTAQTTGVVRVLPIACITKQMAGRELVEMAELVEAGVVAFSDDGKPVRNSRLFRYALEYSKMFDRPIMPHCEDADLVGDGVMNEGTVATRLGLKGWPNAGEEIEIARDLLLAELTGGRLHICHVTTANGVELIRRAKEKGVRVTAEVTPHHLTMTDEWVAGFRWDGQRAHPYDTDTKVNPPLRAEADRQAVVQGLKDGTLDCIATDHAPHTLVDKQCEYDFAAFGFTGFETALGTLMRLVGAPFGSGDLELSQVVSKLTWEPARAFGLPYGTLRPGATADVTVFDPNAAWVVDPSAFASKGKNTPLDGLTLRGQVVTTIVGGAPVYGAESPRVRFVPASELTEQAR